MKPVAHPHEFFVAPLGYQEFLRKRGAKRKNISPTKPQANDALRAERCANLC